MVRLRRRTLSWARALRPSSVMACLSICSPAVSRGQNCRTWRGPMRPLRVLVLGPKRSFCMWRAVTTCSRMVSLVVPGFCVRKSLKGTADTVT